MNHLIPLQQRGERGCGLIILSSVYWGMEGIWKKEKITKRFTTICPTCPECLVSTNISNIFPEIAWPGYRICNLGGCTWESDRTLQTEAVCTSLLTIFLLLLYYRNSKVLHRPAHIMLSQKSSNSSSRSKGQSSHPSKRTLSIPPGKQSQQQCCQI